MSDYEAAVVIPMAVLERLWLVTRLEERSEGYDAVVFRMNVLAGDVRGNGDRRQIIATAGKLARSNKFQLVEQIAGVPMAQFALSLDFAETDHVFAELEKLGIDRAAAIEACRRAVDLVRGTVTRGRKVDGFYIDFRRCRGPWKLRAVGGFDA